MTERGGLVSASQTRLSESHLSVDNMREKNGLPWTPFCGCVGGRGHPWWARLQLQGPFSLVFRGHTRVFIINPVLQHVLEYYSSNSLEPVLCFALPKLNGHCELSYLIVTISFLLSEAKATFRRLRLTP